MYFAHNLLSLYLALESTFFPSFTINGEALGKLSILIKIYQERLKSRIIANNLRF